MKYLFIALIGVMSFQTAGAVSYPAPAAIQTEVATTASKKELKQMKRAERKAAKKERKAMRKQLKKDLKAAIKDFKNSNQSDVGFALLIILGVLIPPLAMLLYDGLSARFWISLLLTLLFFLPGMIYTLYVIISEH